MIVIFYCVAQKEIKKFFDSQIVLQNVEIKSIALPCLAKLEVIYLLKAIENGAKGVAVWGCPDSSCLYPSGSKVGRGRLNYAKRILQEIGLKDFLLQFFGDGLENYAEMEKRFDNWLRKIFSGV